MQLCLDEMVSKATFFNDPARDFKRAILKKDEERQTKVLVLRNSPTQEIKDKTKDEKKVIDIQLRILSILSNFSNKMTDIRNMKQHLDGIICIRVEIFYYQPVPDPIPIPDFTFDSQSSNPNEEEKVEPSSKEEDSIHKTCVQNMKYALNRPECFEKTLIRIIYLMSWLSKDREGEKFLLEMKKPVLELLQDDLGKILGQMAKENIEDSLTELLINQTIRLFKTNQP